MIIICDEATMRKILIVVLLVLAAGCLGGGDGGTDDGGGEESTPETTEFGSISCTSGNLPDDVDLEAVLASAGNGWEQTPPTIEIRGNESAHSGYIKNGDRVTVGIFRFSDTETASSKIENLTLIGMSSLIAQDGRVAMYIATSSGENVPMDQQARSLYTSMACISEDDVREFEISLNMTNSSYTAELESVNTSVERMEAMSSIRIVVEVSGEFEGVTLKLAVEESDSLTSSQSISPSELSDGEANVTLTLTDVSTSGDQTFTVQITSVEQTDINYQEEITVEQPRLEIPSVDVETEEHNTEEGYAITKLSVEVKNVGSTAQTVSVLEVIADEEATYPFDERTIQPGETITIETSRSDRFLLPVLESGENELEIRVGSLSEMKATYNTTVTVD